MQDGEFIAVPRLPIELAHLKPPCTFAVWIDLRWLMVAVIVIGGWVWLAHSAGPVGEMPPCPAWVHDAFAPFADP